MPLPLNCKDRSQNHAGISSSMPYAEIHCVHLLYSSVQLEKIWGKLGPKGLGLGGVYAIIYAMYSMKVTLWLRREQGYLSSKVSTDRKAGRLSLPFYSIEFFGYDC